MRIQDMESRTGLDRASIRFYEREGLITPKRSENGYRDYSEEDADQLMKIKLLRQLGMPVEKIRTLQQGRADFSVSMEEQIEFLSEQIEQSQRAREVCRVIQADGVDYQSMDAEHYLKLLRDIPTGQPVIGKDFQEQIPKEIHPWRRYIARTIDMALFSTVMWFIVIVVLRARPLPGNFVRSLLTIFFGFAYIPVEAFLLSQWGTTPGKLAMGIRLEYDQGGNLPFTTALYRTWRVYKDGLGFCIPVIELITKVIRYCQLTGRTYRRFVKYDHMEEPVDMEWDEDTEMLYGNVTGKEIALLTVLICIILVIGGATGLDAIKPKYRGDELTVAQFAENYNSNLSVIKDNVESYEKIQSDGAKYPVPGNVLIFDAGGKAESINPNFTYEIEDGIIRSVKLENSWEDSLVLNPVNEECLSIATSILLAQDGCGILELYEFTELWDLNLKNSQAQFRYRNVEVKWNIQYENYWYDEGVLISQNSDEASRADFMFQVVLHETK